MRFLRIVVNNFFLLLSPIWILPVIYVDLILEWCAKAPGYTKTTTDIIFGRRWFWG